MEIDFVDLIYLVAPDVNGCPDPVIEKALLDATRRFCTKSTFLKQKLNPVSAVAGTEEYTLVPTAGYEVYALERVWYGEKELFPLVRPPKNTPASGKTPTYYRFPALDKVALYPVPNEDLADAINVYGFLRPIKAATSADSEILDRWEEAIVHGAKSLIMAQPGKAWTNIELSAAHAAGFRAGISEALIQAKVGNTNYRFAAYPEIV